MGTREFHDGAQDGLEALEPLDPEQIGSFDDLNDVRTQMRGPPHWR